MFHLGTDWDPLKPTWRPILKKPYSPTNWRDTSDSTTPQPQRPHHHGPNDRNNDRFHHYHHHHYHRYPSMHDPKDTETQQPVPPFHQPHSQTSGNQGVDTENWHSNHGHYHEHHHYYHGTQDRPDIVPNNPWTTEETDQQTQQSTFDRRKDQEDTFNQGFDHRGTQDRPDAVPTNTWTVEETGQQAQRPTFDMKKETSNEGFDHRDTQDRPETVPTDTWTVEETGQQAQRPSFSELGKDNVPWNEDSDQESTSNRQERMGPGFWQTGLDGTSTYANRNNRPVDNSRFDTQIIGNRRIWNQTTNQNSFDNWNQQGRGQMPNQNRRWDQGDFFFFLKFDGSMSLYL